MTWKITSGIYDDDDDDDDVDNNDNEDDGDVIVLDLIKAFCFLYTDTV